MYLIDVITVLIQLFKIFQGFLTSLLFLSSFKVCGMEFGVDVYGVTLLNRSLGLIATERLSICVVWLCLCVPVAHDGVLVRMITIKLEKL